MSFIGRSTEQSRLMRLFKREGQGVALVYGRRRVGKSELIKECLRHIDAQSIYYECKQTTEANNAQSLASLVAEAFGLPPLAFSSMEEVLDYLFVASRARPLVLVLDEYPYLRKTSEGLDSVIQVLIDRHQDDSWLKLVLCGSYIDVMKSLLEHENPLYGRVDLTIELKPMDYYESSLFYPSFSSEDKVRLYSVFGGIPYYNRLIDSSLSVSENIIELATSPGARLENEVPTYLSSEIAKITNANEVFESLALGFVRYKDILDQSHVSSSAALADVLKKMIRMELVQKRSPINEPNNKKRTSYRIIDPLSAFYYRYIFRLGSQREVLPPEVFWSRYVENDFESCYVPRVFEEVCRQYLIRMNRAGRLDEPFDVVGSYSYDDPKTRTNGEFDVVTRDPMGYVFYEAKFRRAPIDAGMISDEIAQVKACGLECYRYGFFSRGGFTDGAIRAHDDLVCVDIDELYSA